MTPEVLRAYVLIITRDVLSPITGLGLSVYAYVSGVFEPWQIPFLLSLIGVPLVGRIGRASEPPPPPVVEEP